MYHLEFECFIEASAISGKFGTKTTNINIWSTKKQAKLNKCTIKITFKKILKQFYNSFYY
ncbi:hypothetical protein BLOT_009645 [Blomia tropicalis]|nr:hypothetical protein BLOT_009645 [Blomia tropicalis]